MACDNCNMSPLRWAAQQGHLGAVALLFAHGFDPIPALKYPPPLEEAVRGRHTEIARLLIDKGAGLDNPNYDLRTVMFILEEAAVSSSIFHLLVDRGLTAKATPGEAILILQEAVNSGNKDVVQYLLENDQNFPLAELPDYSKRIQEFAKASMFDLLLKHDLISNLDCISAKVLLAGTHEITPAIVTHVLNQRFDLNSLLGADQGLEWAAMRAPYLIHLGADISRLEHSYWRTRSFEVERFRLIERGADPDPRRGRWAKAVMTEVVHDNKKETMYLFLEENFARGAM